jgi:L-ribulokinase
MFASVAAGIHPGLEQAMKAMGQGFDLEYFPDPARAAVYDRRYRRYGRLGDFVEKHLTAVAGNAGVAVKENI